MKFPLNSGKYPVYDGEKVVIHCFSASMIKKKMTGHFMNACHLKAGFLDLKFNGLLRSG